MLPCFYLFYFYFMLTKITFFWTKTCWFDQNASLHLNKIASSWLFQIELGPKLFFLFQPSIFKFAKLSSKLNFNFMN
jgi:hypothetical protein